MANCKICGRALTDPISIALGAGPVCRGGNSSGGKRKIRVRHKRKSRGRLSQAPTGGQLNFFAPGRDLEREEPIEEEKETETPAEPINVGVQQSFFSDTEAEL